jgi:competence protein ComGC
MRSEALLVIRLLLLLLTVVNATKASSSSSSSRSNRAPVLPASIRLVQQQKQHYDLLSKDKVAVTVKDPYETTTTTTTASQQPSTTCPSSSVAIARGGGGKSSALSTTTTTANAFRTRVLSAALMLSGLVAIVHYGGNAGVIQLILCIQVAMYHEVTSVMGLCNDGAVAGGAAWTKWWWFLTYFCTITVKLIFPLNIKSTLTNFIGFGMAVDGIVALVVQQNRQGAQSFGKALGNLAGYNVAAVSFGE